MLVRYPNISLKNKILYSQNVQIIFNIDKATIECIFFSYIERPVYRRFKTVMFEPSKSVLGIRIGGHIKMGLGLYTTVTPISELFFQDKFVQLTNSKLRKRFKVNFIIYRSVKAVYRSMTLFHYSLSLSVLITPSPPTTYPRLHGERYATINH